VGQRHFSLWMAMTGPDGAMTGPDSWSWISRPGGFGSVPSSRGGCAGPRSRGGALGTNKMNE